jgi:hypothetical protein
MALRHRYLYSPTAHLQVPNVANLRRELEDNVADVVDHTAIPRAADFTLTLRLPRFVPSHVRPRFADNESSLLVGLTVFNTAADAGLTRETRKVIGRVDSQHPVRKQRGKRNVRDLRFRFPSLTAAGFDFTTPTVLVMAHSVHTFFDVRAGEEANRPGLLIATRPKGV